jgi:addiction module HigA family antidote
VLETTDKLIPIHPGEILREEYMKPLGFTGDILARVLKVSPDSINEIISGKRGITTDIALRLARYFNTTPELWTGLQEDYDLRMARMGAQLQIARDARKRQYKHRNYQRISVQIIKWAAIVFVTSCLFPPWQYTADRNGSEGFHTRKPAGYAPIFLPPAPEYEGVSYGVQIDSSRLIIEWAALAAVTGMVWMLVVKPAWSQYDKANRPQKFIPPPGNPEN